MCSRVLMIRWCWLTMFWNLIISAPQVFWNWCQHDILSLLNSSVWVSNSWGFSFTFLQRLVPHCVTGKRPCTCVLCSDSKAIVNQNLKLILGLVWTLILHYSISMPCGRMKEMTMPRSRRQSRGCSGGFRTRSPTCPSPASARDWQGSLAKPWELW